MSDIEDFVRDEQVSLWHELNYAIRASINGVWSMQAADIACRIVAAARLVGPTGHDSIPWPLASGGVYDAVLAAGGIASPLTDAARAAGDVLMAEHGPVGADAVARYAATVAAIQSARESSFIGGGLGV